MENSHALSALARRRAEIAGRITQLEKQTESLRATLAHWDYVIRDMSQGEIDPGDIPSRQRFPRRGRQFSYREISRLIYDVLRPLREGEAVSARRIVEHAMRVKGFDPEQDRNIRNEWIGKFLSQLRVMTRNGSLEKIGDGRGVLWRVAEVNFEDAAG